MTTALAKTINGFYKAGLIHRRAPWKTKESLELVTPGLLTVERHIRGKCSCADH